MSDDTLQMTLTLSALGLLWKKKVKYGETTLRQAQGKYPNLCRELEINETSFFY